MPGTSAAASPSLSLSALPSLPSSSSSSSSIPPAQNLALRFSANILLKAGWWSVSHNHLHSQKGTAFQCQENWCSYSESPEEPFAAHLPFLRWWMHPSFSWKWLSPTSSLWFQWAEGIPPSHTRTEPGPALWAPFPSLCIRRTLNHKHIPSAEDSLQTETEKWKEGGGRGAGNTSPQGHFFSGLQGLNTKSISENKMSETMI